MAEAPAADDTLTEADALRILDELLPAQNQAKLLGVKMGLPNYEVEAIISRCPNARDHLHDIIIAFLRQAERPTWRVIVEALRSPAIGRPDLARRVEAAHFPDPTAARDVVPEPVDTESAANTTATGDDDDDEVKSNISSQRKPATVINRSDVASLQKEIKGFHRRFNSIKEATMKCLEKCRIIVSMVVFLLSSILGSEHKKFVKENRKVLRESKSHMELFEELNFYWNYLSFDLLDKLLDELITKNGQFQSIKEDMEKYKEDIQIFRESTPLVLYCQAESHSDCDPPPGFHKMVIKHQWPETVTLEDVERFRRSFLHTVKLEDCAAMVLHNIETGSFKVAWFAELAPSFIQSLSEEMIEVFEDSRVISIEIDEKCVYQSPLFTEHGFRSEMALFVDNCSILSDSTKSFGKKVNTLVQESAVKIHSLKSKKEIREEEKANDAFESIDSVAQRALKFLEKVDLIFQHGKETKAAREALRAHQDNEALRELINSLKKYIDEAEKVYIEFDECYKRANRRCSAAAKQCSERADEAKSRRKKTQVIGGIGTGAAIVGTIAAVVLAFATGGAAVPLAVGLAGAAVGVGGAAATVGLARFFQNAQIAFTGLAGDFDAVWLTTLNITELVNSARDQIKQVMNEAQLSEFNREATCYALQYQQRKFNEYSKETSSQAESLRGKIGALRS